MNITLFPTILGVASIVVLTACTPTQQALPDNWAKTGHDCPADADRSALAGSWLYEEQGYIDNLRLDKRGNGAYEWKGGRFLTSCLDKRDWRGNWKRTQDDSEGGFQISLSEDMNRGEGQWWYTRIGRDKNPARQKSGFQVKRIGALSREGWMPPYRDQTLINRAERP